MKHIRLSDILEFKSPYNEMIETEADRIRVATGGVVIPEALTRLVEEQNLRIHLNLGCSEQFANVLGELARCRAADLTQDEGG